MTRQAAAAPPVLLLFRDDLRLGDNPALHAAAETGAPVLCVHIHDEESPGLRPMGGAARWWRHHALEDLAESLGAIGGRLDLFEGAAAPIVERIVGRHGVTACFWNRRYGAAEKAADKAVGQALTGDGVTVKTFNGTLLHEPSEVRSKTGGAFKVYTPFLRASLALGHGRPLPAPRSLTPGPALQGLAGHTSLAKLHLLPRKPDWAGGLRATWTPTEAQAQAQLHAFLDEGIVGYGERRNHPDAPAASRLSPFLRHGQISPRQVVARASHAAEGSHAKPAEVDKFVAEVVWRDFCYNLLVEHPDLATAPVQPAFGHFPYRKVSAADLQAWTMGRTGYPIVDAGMRQLWTTGIMHNRVRMITASFLIKHMLADWRVGEQWFWDTLCDADPGSNPGNWQWVAGCGADAAPYFRIFNPIVQGEKFDADGAYVRRYVPELAAMPLKWIHRPWDAPPDVLAKADVVLGKTYPRPIVEHEPARERALKALAAMRGAD